jgi:predicted transcriptional regulator
MLDIDPFALPESRRFAILRHWALVCGHEVIEAVLAAHGTLSPEARELCAQALHSYAAGALAMPYGPFLETAETWRYDIDRLARRFGVSYEQAAHRLSTLRRPGQPGVRFAFMRSDASGFVTKRLPLTNLPLPRHATACPLWAVHGAFQSPGVTVRNIGELPSGDRFLFFARAIDKVPAVAGRPRRLLSVMLACNADEAGRVIYGDGLQHEQAVVPVGTVCRLCRRPDCRHRQEAPLVV